MTLVRLEPAALRSRVKNSTTEPLRSLLILLIEPFRERALPTLHITTKRILTLENPKNISRMVMSKYICDALTFLLESRLDNIFIRFGTKLYRQVVGISMDTNCAPLVADLFLFCHEILYDVSFR